MHGERDTTKTGNFKNITEVFSFLLVELNDITSMEGDVAISNKITYVFFPFFVHPSHSYCIEGEPICLVPI